MQNDDHARPESDVASVQSAFHLLDAMTPEQRVEVMTCFCPNCYANQPARGRGCQCWNDE